MNALAWELKSPLGKSKRTIRDKLSIAKTQSPNIIIDSRRTSLSDMEIEADLRRQIILKKSIYRLILITKDEKVLVIK